MVYSSVIPVGGASVTNDIAIGLRTSVDTAEKIKIEYGTTIPDEVRDTETIDLSLISKIDTQKISKASRRDYPSEIPRNFCTCERRASKNQS